MFEGLAVLFTDADRGEQRPAERLVARTVVAKNDKP